MALTLGVVMVAYAAGMVNYFVPTLRFSSPVANVRTFAAMQVLPFLFIPLAFGLRERWRTPLGCLVFAPLACFAGLLGAFAVAQMGWIVEDGYDASFERLEVLPLPAGELSIYRTDGGATTSFGIVVRQECSIGPGLLLVRDVWNAYPASEVEVKLRGESAEIWSPPYGEARPFPLSERVDLDWLLCSFGR